MKNILAWILGIILTFLFIGICWIFVSNFQQASPNVKAGLIGFVGTITAALTVSRQTKKREIESRHFSDKREGYMNFIDILFDFIKDIKHVEEIDQKELEKNMLKFKKSLLVWGNSDLIRAWNKYEINANNLQGDPSGIIMEMDRALKAIRKDLGHSDAALSDGELVSIFLTSEAKEELRN